MSNKPFQEAVNDSYNKMFCSHYCISKGYDNSLFFFCYFFWIDITNIRSEGSLVYKKIIVQEVLILYATSESYTTQ